MTAISIAAPTARFNKVPEVTLDFWLVKLLAVTVGETAADYMNFNLGFGITRTTLVLTALLAVALAAQFMQRGYRPSIYWICVVLISVVGTLVTDNLVDNYGVSLEATLIAFTALLALTFFVWHRIEGTLSIHTIFTVRREAFYWLAILFTFALGTAAGDFTAESAGLGYLATGILFSTVIGVIVLAYYAGWMNSIWAFWLAYILTRPVGASLGDFLAQPHQYGGLGLGVITTSYLFLALIMALVIWMTLARRGYGPATPSAANDGR